MSKSNTAPAVLTTENFFFNIPWRPIPDAVFDVTVTSNVEVADQKIAYIGLQKVQELFVIIQDLIPFGLSAQQSSLIHPIIIAFIYG